MSYSFAKEFADLEVVQKFVHTVFLSQPTPASSDGMGQEKKEQLAIHIQHY